MQLAPHSNAWYDWLATQQAGYFYPWRSHLETGNGEDIYTCLVNEHRTAGIDVLDVGCGHGQFTLSLAPHCRSVIGYDRVVEYIRLAKRACETARAENVRFLLHDSAPRANGGHARMPVTDRSVDLMISRRGPLHWIADARRAGRPGAVLIQLNPVESEPPPWNGELPPLLQLPRPAGEPIRKAVHHRLKEASIRLEKEWLVSVEEWFDHEPDLYARLIWGRDRSELPTWEQSAEPLKNLFHRHAGARGLVMAHERYLWTATIPRDP